MAKIDDPLITVTRNGATILVARAMSVAINTAIGEAPEHDVSLLGAQGERIKEGDGISISVDGVAYGPYTISTLSRSPAGNAILTDLVLAGCGSILRDIPVVDDDISVAGNNLAAFRAVSEFVTRECGVVFPVSFVNAEYVLMDSAFSVRASNALDMMRSLAGATGNALRITPSCGIEIGKFGEDSGLFFTNSPLRSRGLHTACTLVSHQVDVSDVFGWLFVEGGSFLKKANPSDPTDMGESVNLGLGSRYLNTFTITPPAGYEITEVEAGKRLHYKLKRIASTVRRGKRIQIAAITPKNLNDLASEITAANLLAKSAALYLEAKEAPETIIDLQVDGHVRVLIGDLADVYIESPNGTIVDGSYSIISSSITVNEGKPVTQVSLSSRLTDPEDLLKAGATVKSGSTGRKDNQMSGVQGTAIIVTPGLSGVPCGGTGKESSVSYWFAEFLSVPTVEFELEPGVSAVVLSATLTDATICFYKATPWTGAEIVKIILIGPRAP